MSLLDTWNNPLHQVEFRLEVAVAEIDQLRQRVAELEDQVTEVPQIMRKLAACEKERDELRQRVVELEHNNEVMTHNCEATERMLAACEQERDEYACMSFASSLIDCKGKLAACEKERDEWRDLCAASRKDHEETREQLAASQESERQMAVHAVTLTKERDDWKQAEKNWRKMFAAEQHYAQQLRKLLRRMADVAWQIDPVLGKVPSGSDYRALAMEVKRELSITHDTSALDALTKERDDYERKWLDAIQLPHDTSSALDALVKDAERYRWLRKQERPEDFCSGAPSWEVSYQANGMGQVMRNEKLDAAIDAARGEKQNENHQSIG